eukprot:Phypoly_transcript_08028.p1 GENE.Phypoly_transcript_08028~~Phypoly_transcript_08028.p1  ORF type:complete len:391 (+),score=73.79 Phypoly_transcript_08028:224-1396(+)
MCPDVLSPTDSMSKVPSLFYMCATVIAHDCNTYAPSLLSLPSFVLDLLLKAFSSIPFGYVSLLELKYNDPEIRQHTSEFVWEKALADAKYAVENSEVRYYPHFLVVEDNPVDRKFIIKVLERCVFCTYAVADNGRTACEKTQDTDFDMIFMDMSMPEMGGWEATSIIKERVDRPYVPIVAVSAIDRDVCLGGKYTSPVDDFVSKPVYANKLTSVLLKYQSEWQCMNEGETTALHFAAQRGYTGAVMDLVDLGAQVNALDKNGATPLHLASKNGHTETASMLITLGASVELLDSENLTPLCAATTYGHVETASALVALGGDVGPQCRTRSGVYAHVPRSALEIARDQGDEEMVRQLLASGANAEGAAAMLEKERKKEGEKFAGSRMRIIGV